MNEIHMSLPVYFPASEAFVEGVNAVGTVLFFCFSWLVYFSCTIWRRFLFFHYWGVPMSPVFAMNAVHPVYITPPPWLWWQGVAKNRMFIWHHARWYSAANPHLLSLSYTRTHTQHAYTDTHTHDRSKKYAYFLWNWLCCMWSNDTLGREILWELCYIGVVCSWL